MTHSQLPHSKRFPLFKFLSTSLPISLLSIFLMPFTLLIYAVLLLRIDPHLSFLVVLRLYFGLSDSGLSSSIDSHSIAIVVIYLSYVLAVLLSLCIS
ncbi:hypothetical protein V8D89_004426 [Ganoderma adspersum]